MMTVDACRTCPPAKDAFGLTVDVVPPVSPWNGALGHDDDLLYEDPVAKSKIGRVMWSLAATAGAGLGAYHGYKRNESIGWALWWGFWGGLVPVFTVPVAFAQGFGKKK